MDTIIYLLIFAKTRFHVQTALNFAPIQILLYFTVIQGRNSSEFIFSISLERD